MNIRPLQNSDLKVTKGWGDSRNRQRIFVSLVGASWCNKTYWLTEAEQQKPETITRIKEEMQAVAAAKLLGFKKFIV